MKRSRKKTNNRIRIISWIIIFILGILSILFLITVNKINVLPAKYYLILCIILVVIFLLLLTISFLLRRKSVVLIIIDIISIILISVFILGYLKTNELAKFLSDNLRGETTEILEYSIIANKNYILEKNDSLRNMKFLMPEDTDNKEKTEAKVEELFNGIIDYKSTESDLVTEVETNKEQLVIIKKAFYDATIEDNKSIRDNTKELTSFSIDIKVKLEKKTEKSINDPFVIYLSGIDTRSNSMPVYSLSDVNMLIAVNPKSKNLLMVHIPRDYYVQLHGTTGLKDKLTHAGIKGGVQLSMDTISDFIGVKIDYYIKVNFNAVIKLVDAIGGITLYNELDHSFSCWTDRSCVFYPGNNTVNGKCALAYARERHAYSTGDVHRGQNQQEVIEKVINKISSSKTLISNYSDILQALDGTFTTSLTQEDLSELVKSQLDSMSGWNIKKYNITGFDDSNYTYSYPNQKSYVMNPDQTKVDEAKKLISEVLNK